jgi:D-glycero-alpha-D-manno-heptose-7-phosphate kinase
MILVKSPLRVSFLGGGTDFPSYFLQRGGAVISTTIDKHVYVALNIRNDKSIRVSYSKTEETSDVSSLDHDIIREILLKYRIETNLEIVTIADMSTKGTGLGSSSSLSAAVICGVKNLLNIQYNSRDLAMEACELEIKTLNKPIGMQDQYISAYGGFNKIKFLANGDVVVEPIKFTNINLNEISKWFKLLAVNTRQSASESLMETIDSINDSKKQIYFNEIYSLIDDLHQNFVKFEPKNIGQIINIGWKLKKEFGKSISNQQIDFLIDRLLGEGLLGAKLVGAGGGGFVLLFAEPDWYRNKLDPKLQNKIMDLNLGVEGTRLVYRDS